MLKIIAKDVLGIPTKQQEKCLDDVAALPEKVLYDSQLDVAIWCYMVVIKVIYIYMIVVVPIYEDVVIECNIQHVLGNM